MAEEDVIDPRPATYDEARERRVRGGGREQRAVTFAKRGGEELTLWYSWATLMHLGADGTRLTLLFTDYRVTLTGRNLRVLRNRLAAAMEDVVRETAEGRDFAGDAEAVVYRVEFEERPPGSAAWPGDR